ncbi:serine hydrolase [uncultured Sphingomonas sp.]|uniref:serine hydrolase n=1 Tax=uncultured Sphingomonas sp. TaxID=158754 RepID=UPI0025E86F25|nr:serine hydrolase [uncultured Sphingomonas sp.]
MRLALAFAAAIAVAAPALAAPPAGFEQRVERLRTSYGAPGVSIAIVENGRATLAKGWGVREIGKPDPVGPDTIFGTGSTGKAFTVAALAILVDQGKLKWDDKVIDHMPDFRMWDPWVTREMTVRDLLVHRSGLGLGAGDLLFVPNSNLSRKETVRRVRFIKPATSFRSGYAYDNILYMVAGQLVEEVSGQTWEQFMQAQVFTPLGMNRSTESAAEFQATADRARPHGRYDGPIHGMGRQQPYGPEAALAGNAAPAGGLAISANDMTRWLLTQLAQGQIPGSDRRLYSAEQAKEMWTPVTLQPIDQRPPEFAVLQPDFSAYALGWDVEDYRGTKIVWHGGAVFGSLTAVALIPEKNVGFSIAVNSEEGQIVRGLMYELLDHYLGLPQGNWPGKYHAFRQSRLAEAAKLVTAAQAKPARVGPSLSLDRYVGDYADPWYGTIKVRRSGRALAIQFPHSRGMDSVLVHHQYDTFRTRPALRWIEPAYVTFSIDADGKVDRIRMKPVSPLADFSFDYQDLDFAPVAASAKEAQ